MKKAAAVICLGTLLFLSGCITYNLHPFYTKDVVVFEPELVGSWGETVDGDAETVLEFRRGDNHGYIMVHTDEDGSRAAFDAYLSRVEGHYFLDIRPREPSETGNELYSIHLFPMHTVVYISQLTPVLKINAVETGRLAEYLEDHPQAIKHEIVKEDRINLVVLTAGPQELQRFFADLVEIDGIFESSPGLKKIK